MTGLVDFLQSIPTGVYGLLAVLLPTAIALARGRKRKRLWYDADVYSVVGKNLSSRIQVSLDSKVLPDVYVCPVRLLYKGTEPLLKEHFQTPIVFDFGDSQVLDVEVTKTLPEGIKATVYTDKDNKFRFNPVALNNDSLLYARVLLTKRALPKATSHIVDVPPIQHMSQRNSLMKKGFIGSLDTFVIGGILLMLGLILGAAGIGTTSEVHPIAGYGFGFLALTMVLFFVTFIPLALRERKEANW